MEELTYIYSLEYPEGNIRYIGKADDPEDRFRGHIKIYKNTQITHKVNWIKSLLKKGLIPKLIILDKIPQEEWVFWEKHYISLYKSWGFKLTNSTDGGEGLQGFTHSEESLEKMRQSSTGKFHSEESKNKMSESRTGEKNHMFGKTGESAPWFGREHEKLTCPYCDKIGGVNVMNQWHFDNCLENPKNDKEEIKKLRRENSSMLGRTGELNPNTGKKHKYKKRKTSICPYCKKEGGSVNMERYHFDNCLENPKNDPVEIKRQRRESNPNFNKKQEIVTCPWCKESGGSQNMDRYHFENCLKNPKYSKEDVIKIKKGRQKLFKQVVCPHCGKVGKENGMSRYHFNNCKYKNDKRAA